MPRHHPRLHCFHQNAGLLLELDTLLYSGWGGILLVRGESYNTQDHPFSSMECSPLFLLLNLNLIESQPLLQHIEGPELICSGGLLFLVLLHDLLNILWIEYSL